MILLFNSESTVGSIAMKMERQLRPPWDTFVNCVLGHFFCPDSPNTVPERRTLVDSEEGIFFYM